MNNKVLRIDRCELCGETKEYYIRDKRINSTLTDNDIINMLRTKIDEPQSYKYCEGCDLITLTTTVGWRGIEH